MNYFIFKMARRAGVKLWLLTGSFLPALLLNPLSAMWNGRNFVRRPLHVGYHHVMEDNLGLTTLNCNIK